MRTYVHRHLGQTDHERTNVRTLGDIKCKCIPRTRKQQQWGDGIVRITPENCRQSCIPHERPVCSCCPLRAIQAYRYVYGRPTASEIFKPPCSITCVSVRLPSGLLLPLLLSSSAVATIHKSTAELLFVEPEDRCSSVLQSACLVLLCQINLQVLPLPLG